MRLRLQIQAAASFDQDCVMFGPNVRSTLEGKDGKYFHHRSADYRHLLLQTVGLLRKRLNISKDFDVLILTGSGTLANEAVIASLSGPTLTIKNTGEFARRLIKLALAQNKDAFPPMSGYVDGVSEHQAMVAYETAEAKHVAPLWAEDDQPQRGIRFADCVSAVPYYGAPEGADVWTTVSSKQIGALPVLSIVVVRRSAWDWFRPAATYSYLNLRRYADAYYDKGESPHTPAIPLLHDLRERLTKLDVELLRRKIDNRREYLQSVFGKDAWGEGPVLNVSLASIPLPLAQEWNLYRAASTAASTSAWQFFLYSGTGGDYSRFVAQLKRYQHAKSK